MLLLIWLSLPLRKKRLERVRYKMGVTGFDWVPTVICARQREAMVSVKTLKQLNANDDIELQDFALAA